MSGFGNLSLTEQIEELRKKIALLGWCFVFIFKLTYARFF